MGFKIQNGNKWSALLKKITRGFRIVILIIAILICAILLLIQTKPVQNYARKKIVSYLTTKLNTKVEINDLTISFPKVVVLEDIYIEDLRKDTLLYAHALKVDISMYKLIFGKIQINDIQTNSLKVKILRQLPDKTFNYQFIMDAFASKSPRSDVPSKLKMGVDHLLMEQTSVTFLDYMTGNNVFFLIDKFETDIDVFDPVSLRFDVPDIRISGVVGKIYQSSAIEIVTSKKTENADNTSVQTNHLNINNKHLNAKDVRLDYTNEVSALQSSFRFNRLDVFPEKIDLSSYEIYFNKVELDQFDGLVKIGSEKDSKLVNIVTGEGEVLEKSYLPWKIKSGQIKILESRLKFDDMTKVKLLYGMDFRHLDARELSFGGDNFFFHRDTIKINITEGRLKESSGFVLDNLQSEVLYTDKEISLQNNFIKTPGSVVRKNFNITYPSLAAAVLNPSLFNFNLQFVRSSIQIKDILLFVPLLRDRPGFKNPDVSMHLDGLMTGTLKKLHFESIIFESFHHTKADFSGSIENITQIDKIFLDLVIRNISTTSDDIQSIAVGFQFPENVILPQNIALSGRVSGDMDSLFTDVSIMTSTGDASFVGFIKNSKNPAIALYDADVSLHAFQPGEIFRQAKLVNNVDAAFHISGLGTDPATTNLKINGVVQNVRYNQYNYTNIALNADVNGRYIKTKGSIRDPNISLRFSGEGEMTSGHPCIIMDADIDIINAKSLHFTKEKVVYSGNIWMDIPAFDLDKLRGEVHVTASDLRMNDKRIHLDSMSVIASYADDIQKINLKSDFLNAAMEGVFQIDNLGNIFKNLMHQYYKFEGDTIQMTRNPYTFKITAQLNDHPALRLFLPGLQRLEKISLNAFFADSSGWKADLKAPFISYAGNVVHDLNMGISADGQQLLYNAEVLKIKIGNNIEMNGTKLGATIADQKVNFSVRIGDKKNADRYIFGGLLEQKSDYYTLSVNDDVLMLNYDNWKISNNNIISVGREIFNVEGFDISKDNQHLIIQSKSTALNSPVEVAFRDFRLSTLTDFVMADSMKVDGTVNGIFTIDDINTRPVFTSDIFIKDLFVKEDTIGDIRIDVSNADANEYKTNISLSGRNNDVMVTGSYNLKPANKANLDFLLDIKSLQMKTLEGASMGNIRESKGYLTGKVKIGGSLTSPDIAGNLEFFKASMIIDKLNSEFKVDNGQLLAIDNTGLRFNNFTIKDVSDNRFVINGMAYTKNYFNYQFDLKMRARNFKALNSTRADNQAYYGQIFFDTDMKISGTEAAPVVDGRIRINEGTALTIVIPQKEPGLVAREGVVVFVDKSKPVGDTEGLGALDSLNITSFKGMDVSVNIEVDKKAILTLVIDEGNNDFIKLKGEAILTGGIDKSGKVTLTGTYELDEGTYELSFNLIDRSFNIQKGSKITWTGEPTDATMDITAVYVANTTAVELVQDQIVAARTDLRYRQRLPFEVHLSMKGALLKPELSFEIKLPKESTVRIDGEIAAQIEMRLNQLKAEPSELNKQVFSLLILNRFTSQNPFETAGGGLNPESMARQSVSKIMTEQLNNLANDLISGVDVNFDIVSSEDFTSGKMQNKTDVNVGVSKKLFSERLNVSVGTNIAVEGGQKNSAATNPSASNVPNLNIEYLLSKNGQYMLRAYRRNQYEGIVEGYIVETGVGFVMSVDYDQFKDIFTRRKSNRNLRERQKKTDNKRQTPDLPVNNGGEKKPVQESDLWRKNDDE